MTEKRRYPRYQITDQLGIRFRLSQIEIKDFEFVSLSQGGIGFYGSGEEFGPAENKIVRVGIEWAPYFKGELLLEGFYRHSEKFDGPEGECRYFGVAFTEPSQKLMEPVVALLRKLASPEENETPALSKKIPS